MRLRIRTAAAGLLAAALTAGCQNSGAFESAQSASLEDDDQKASYAIGVNVGINLLPTGDHLQMDAFLRGMQDALAERDPALEEPELGEVMQRFSQTIQEEQQAEAAATAERNRTEGAEYMAANGAKDGVTTTESGLQYEVLRAGDGARPTPEDQVTINYRGTLTDGTEFDSSYDGEPVTFRVGGVIDGFAEGLQLMEVGSQYRLVIPGDLGYGPQGTQGDIGPNATLIFEIELLEIPAAGG